MLYNTLFVPLQTLVFPSFKKLKVILYIKIYKFIEIFEYECMFIQVPCNSHNTETNQVEFISTDFHDNLLIDLLLTHSTKDFCIIGSKVS